MQYTVLSRDVRSYSCGVFLFLCMNGFSIIIVSWNARPLLEQFLPSVCATSYPIFEVILADNGSDDDTISWIEREYPQVKIVRHGNNLGFCAGNNRAAPHAAFDNLVFLNNDVRVEPNWLHAINDMLQSNAEIGVIQPKIRSHREPASFEYAGAAGGFLDRFGYPFCRGRIFDSVEIDAGQYDQASPIFWASGAAMVVRRSIFEQTGGFEESFGFHMEEIDLCWRIQHLGWQIWYCPDSVVYHLGGGSLAPDSPRKLYFNFRNNLRMLLRNHPSEGLLKLLFIRIALDKVAMLRFAFQGKFRHAFAVFRALTAFAGNIKVSLEFRRNHPPVSPPTVPPAKLSIVKAYFIDRIRRFHELPSDSS